MTAGSYPRRSSVTVTVPGRLCLAGESLDWMVGGSSIVAAVPLRIRVTAWWAEGSGALALSSGPPLSRTRLVPATRAAAGRYDGDALDLMQAAARVALDGVEPLLAGTVLTASTELPVGAGVSSSAALALAAVAAVRALRDGHAVGTWAACELAHRAETIELGSGAGWMDFLACSSGGVNHVHAGGAQPYAQLIAPSLDVPVILIDTLARRTTTAVLAAKRQRFREQDPDMEAYVRQAPVLVEALAAALRRRPVDYREVGALLTNGQNLLRDRVHCSTALIDRCIERITAAGAYGAKLSGSGHGGVLFALAPPGAVSSILGAVQDLPVHAIALPRCDPSGLLSGLSSPVMAGDGSPQTGG